MPTSPLWTRVTATLLLLASGLAGADVGVRGIGDKRWSDWVADGFKQINTSHGLPNEVVTSVTEDPQGFLWVGTMGGVARWDGYQFVNRRFTATAGMPAQVADNLVQVLHTDTQGRLWVGTDAVGLIRLGRSGEALHHIAAGPAGLSHGSVRALANDGQGGLWVGTDGGLDHVDGASGRVQRIAMGPQAANGLRGENATAVLRDRAGRLWVGTTAGLFVREAGSDRFSPVALPDAGGRQPQAESLLEDSAGRLWMGTNRDGVFVREAEGGAGTWRAILETQAGRDARTLASRRVMALLEARPGEVWAGTLGQGVVAIDAASGQTRRLRHRPLLPSSLPDDHVRGLFRDRSGLVWVATYAGLARVDPRDNAVLNVSPDRGVVDTTQSRADYVSLLVHSDGRVWMGTLSHGVEIVDPARGRLLALKPDPSRPESAVPPDATLGLAEAPDGSVFIGNYRGLYRARAPAPGAPSTGAAAAPTVVRVSWPGRLADRGVGPLFRDGQRLWVGGLRDGLWEMDLASGRARAALPDPARQLTDLRITALARGAQGELWIGTRNGLNRYDPATGAVLKLPASPATGGLGSGFIASLCLDRQGRLWVATYGGGLHRLEPGDGPPRFARVSADEGLPDNNVNTVIEDDAGRIWASTDSGLALVDTTTMRARGLRRAEGVGYATFWTNSVARTDAGELLFGASGGVTVVRPALLRPWTHRPPVVVTELRVGGRELPPPEGTQSLRVPPEANSLEVGYAALDYSAPERNRYAHRLLGHDSDWVASDPQRRLASYNNLPPGDYQLQLRGSNRDGTFSESTLSLPIQVLAPWHQTAWFRALAGLAMLALVYGLVHARTRVLLARRQELQRLVDERTVELQAVSLALSEKTRALEEKSRVLEVASISDPLTGLHNRRFLTEHIEAALSASLRRALTGEGGAAANDTDTLFFLIDVDHFKRVNDEHGHAAGDAVLVQLAQRLKVAMRESDDVVRWGGEEFLAVAHDTDRARADELAERLRAGVAETPFRLPDGRSLAMSCSIGHACWPFLPQHPQALDWLAVVNVADVALLTAKRLGRNAWVGLQATAASQPEGLASRVSSAPQQALLSGELAFTSSHPVPAAVAEAMVAH